MNRILIDEVLDYVIKESSNSVICDICDNNNYLLDDKYDNYELNIKDSKTNILLLNNSEDDIKIKINIESSVVYFNIFSFKSSNLNLNVSLKNKDSNINIYNSFVLSDKNNINIKINHESSNTYSNVKNRVVTKDKGYSNIKVVSSVKKGNKNCIINQDSKIISLNDNNKNRVEPILLIDEYETEAKHSCFIGKYNENEMFYLESKGLSKKDACKLLLEGTLVGTLKISDLEKKFIKEKLNI